MGKTGLLLVGHGSKLPYNKDLVENTASLITEKYPEYCVRCAFVSMNSPGIGEALDSFRQESIDALVVVPLLLAKGVHIIKDIPEAIGLPEGKTTGTFSLKGRTIPLRYADPIGSDPLLAELMVRNAKRALSDL